MSQKKVNALDAKNNWEVITTTDKAARDRTFEDLRKNGNENERQVVKFSSVQLVEGRVPRVVRYTALGKGGVVRVGKEQLRPVYESTWSVAYPREAV